MASFFYDSYAIIEFIGGNPVYQKYFTKHEGVTTLYNVMEVYYSVLREEGLQKAQRVLGLLAPIVVYPTIDHVETSMQFRLKYKDKRLSYADCLGYAIAAKRGVPFLTGDEGFRHISNVEFVK